MSNRAFFDELVAEAVRSGHVNLKGWVRVNCPLCLYVVGKEDRKRSFGFNAMTLRYECYRCETKGQLRQRPDEYTGYEDQVAEPAEPIVAPDGFYFLAPNKGALSLEPAFDYLYGRGVTDEQIAAAQLGACVTGKYVGRVVVPIFTPSGDWGWFVARAWQKKHDRPYLYPQGDRQGIIFNWQELAVDTSEPLLVMEGCFDAIAHMPCSVGALGKVTDDRVLDLLMAETLPSRPKVFVPDGDEWEAGAAAADRLRLAGHQAGALRLPPRVDPDEIPRAELWGAALDSLTT